MALNVQANVVDVSLDAPTKEDKFLVDTNVWLWMSYTRASTHDPQQPTEYQLSSYPRYLKQAREAGATLYATAYTYAELAKVIELAELRIYQDQSGNKLYPLKVFRHESSRLYDLALEQILE